MATEFTGAGDRDRTLALLWRQQLDETGSNRGPRPKVSVDGVVSAAIELADEEGLDALSMRRLADRLGIGTMSLYTHVANKPELVDLMIDQVTGDIPREAGSAETPRLRLEQLAREDLAHYVRHPWVLQVDTSRPPIGPGISDRYEYQLGLIEGIGIGDVDMDSIITLVTSFAAAAATAVVNANASKTASGQTDGEWWEANLPTLNLVMEESRFPVSGRVGQAAGEFHQSSGNPEYAFEFGLQRMLDGIDRFVSAA